MIVKPAFDLTVATVPQYLARRGFDPDQLRVRELSGGVSNIVLLVESPRGRFVLKQALPQLRVEQEWLCDIRRIFVEAEALRAVAGMLPTGAVPEVLFEDRENFAFAMTAAAEGSRTWKSILLGGETDPYVAERAGWMLARVIRESQGSPSFQRQFADRKIFEDLRLDPYYRYTGDRYPELANAFGRLIEDCRARCVSLVHGDWSPKNILVQGQDVMAIDFEVMHFGDPSFDAAFLLNHFLLKTFYGIDGAPELARVFWSTLQAEMPSWNWFEGATLAHLGGLLLARMDGKSPAEYIRDADMKDRIRRFAKDLMLDPPETVAEVWRRYASHD